MKIILLIVTVLSRLGSLVFGVWTLVCLGSYWFRGAEFNFLVLWIAVASVVIAILCWAVTKSIYEIEEEEKLRNLTPFQRNLYERMKNDRRWAKSVIRS